MICSGVDAETNVLQNSVEGSTEGAVGGGGPACADALANGAYQSFNKASATVIGDRAKSVVNIMPSAPHGDVGGSEGSALI